MSRSARMMRGGRVGLALTGLVALCSCHTPAPVSPEVTHDVWRYDLHVPADGKTLDVTATIRSDVSRTLTVDRPARGYVTDVAIENGVATRDAIVCHPPQCIVRYRFALAAAALALHDSDVVEAHDDAHVAATSAILLHPSSKLPRSYRLTVQSDGPAVLTALPRSPGGAPGQYEVSGAGLDEAPWIAIGRWATREERVGTSTVTIGIAPGPRRMDDQEISQWVASAASSVAVYFDGTPVERPLVLVIPGDGDSIDGKTLGGGGGSILLRLGSDVSMQSAKDSWVLVHEMVHLNLPSLGPPHTWLEEGLATYLEPIIRARDGTIPAKQVWTEWVRDMPQGMPKSGDGGLERTSAWERVYWGGAVFCFEADLEIRRRTGGRRSLEDALRGMAKTSTGVAEDWSIDRFIRAADDATGVPVLRELYERFALAPGKSDLDALWRDLGVVRDGESVASLRSGELSA